MERKKSPNRNHQLTCFVRPELIHRPLCFHKATPHNHTINLVLWGQSSAADDKADDTPSGRVAATAGILQQSFPTEAREHGNGASVLTLPPTFLMTLVTSLHKTPPLPQPFSQYDLVRLYTPQGLGVLGLPSINLILPPFAMWWGATPARDRLPITNGIGSHWYSLSTHMYIFLSNLLQEVMPRLFCLLSKKDSIQTALQ